MSTVAEFDPDDERPSIVIRCAETGEAFDFAPSADLWLDMQAYAAVAGVTIEQLIHAALERFFAERRA